MPTERLGLGFLTQALDPLCDVPAWQLSEQRTLAVGETCLVAVGPQVDASQFAGTGRSLVLQTRIEYALDPQGRLARVARHLAPVGDKRPQEIFELYDYGAAVRIEPPPQERVDDVVTESGLCAAPRSRVGSAGCASKP